MSNLRRRGQQDISIAEQAQDAKASQIQSDLTANTLADTAEKIARQEADITNFSADALNAANDAANKTAQATRDTTQDAIVGAIPLPYVISGTSTSASEFTFTFPFAFKSPPVIQPRETWIGTTRVSAVARNITATNCLVTVMRSKGTLLLSAGAFEQAPSGIAFELLVIGVKA